MTYNVTTAQMTYLIALAAWEMIWKGMALWRASQLNQRGWFLALLVINSAGILPIIYMLMTDFRPDAVDEQYFKTPTPHRS